MTIQCDEVWSFVGKKPNKQWIWLALDADTGVIANGSCFVAHAMKLVRLASGRPYRMW